MNVLKLHLDYFPLAELVKHFSLIDIYIPLTVVMSPPFLGIFHAKTKNGYYLCNFNIVDKFQRDWNEYLPAQNGEKTTYIVHLFFQEARAPFREVENYEIRKLGNWETGEIEK